MLQAEIVQAPQLAFVTCTPRAAPSEQTVWSVVDLL